MNKKVIWLSAIALSMSVSQATLACHGTHKSMAGGHFEKMSSKLDLTADQKAKIKTISDQAMETLKPKLQEMRNIHNQLNDLVNAKDIDESKVDDLIKQKTELSASIMKTRLMTRHEINMVLTDAQRAKMADMVAKWKAKHMKNQD